MDADAVRNVILQLGYMAAEMTKEAVDLTNSLYMDEGVPGRCVERHVQYILKHLLPQVERMIGRVRKVLSEE
jgi:hypothetical protein